MLKHVIVLAAALTAANAAQVQHPNQITPSARGNGPWAQTFSFSCISFQVGGNAPSIQMTNNGPGVVPAGTKVHWVVKASSGDYVFPAPVQVHQITVLNGVARSGIGGCTATVVN